MKQRIPTLEPKAKVDVRRLKEFAFSNLPEGSKLRDLILGEKEELGVEEFLAKMDLWLKLLKIEIS